MIPFEDYVTEENWEKTQAEGFEPHVKRRPDSFTSPEEESLSQCVERLQNQFGVENVRVGHTF